MRLFPDPTPVIPVAGLALITAVAVILSGSGAAPAVAEPADAVASEAVETMPVEAESARLVVDNVTSGAPIPFSMPGDTGIATPATTGAPIVAPTARQDGEVAIGLPGDAAIGERVPGGAVRYSDPDLATEFTIQSADVPGVPEIAGGVRTLISVLDESAPGQYAFDVGLPAGVHLEAQPDGSVSAVDQAGGLHGTFAPPWAVDANGTPISTRYEVRCDTLVQHISHEGATYPVIADPVWFVPVLVIGARVAAQVVAKAATKRAAQQLAKKAAVQQGWARSVTKVKKVSSPSQARGRSHTQSNLRHNLKVRTHKNPKGCQAHHTMPVKFASQFARVRGLNINDPKYALWWNSTKGLRNNHQSLARLYNSDWDRFFKQFSPRRPPTKQQILAKRSQLVKKYAAFYRC